MSSPNSKSAGPEFSRREFLLTVGAGAPSLRLMDGAGNAAAATPGRPEVGGEAEGGNSSGKFTPIPIDSFFNSSSQDFGRRDLAQLIGGESARDSLIRVLGGKRQLLGIPFELGPEDVSSKRWLVLSSETGAASTASVEIPVGKSAHYLCFFSFNDFNDNPAPQGGRDAFQNLGQHLADVSLIYDDNTTYVHPVRRRFETNAVVEAWGHRAFNALPPGANHGLTLTDPLKNALDWGNLQVMTGGLSTVVPNMGTAWVCALENPHPEQTVKAVRVQALGDDAWVLCGLTLYHRPEHPLRCERRTLYRLTLPEAAGEDLARWKIELDLGTVGRTYALPEFDAAAWLASPAPGLGEASSVAPGTRFLYTEAIASNAATLTLRDAKTGKRYDFELSKAVAGSELPANEGGGSIELLERGRQWIHCRVVDSETHQPTAVRLAFRSLAGRYIPPYGHREEINDAWFQDYGADVKLMDSSFAYVDGTFQVELPPGEVYVEMTKGFEYHAVRRKLEIQPGQRELTLEIPRMVNLRQKGWITADTHTHFLSPTTALLEAQAEGLNLINLLAAQWGALFTNIGDLSHGPLLSADREAMVWVGTENRQHLLGHIGLEGVVGNAVMPLSADGPSEGFVGDPLWSSMAEWAEGCRQRQGLAVAVHFPYPTGEIAADIVLGKIDAVEIWPRDDPKVKVLPLEEWDSLRYLDWYHFMNCGYRLPAVAGTDKMGAYMPAGTNRVYAYLGQEEFTFPNFARAVRSGNTFASSGPLLMFTADGHMPGSTITLGAGGGTVEVNAHAQCFVPIHRLEVILNGRVVASREEPAGAREINLTEKIRVDGPGWLAARCASQHGPTTIWLYKIAAHTSAVYIDVPGRELFSPEAAAYFLQLIDGTQSYVDTLAIRADDETLARIRKVYTDARAVLHRRLHEHGIPH